MIQRFTIHVPVSSALASHHEDSRDTSISDGSAVAVTEATTRVSSSPSLDRGVPTTDASVIDNATITVTEATPPAISSSPPSFSRSVLAADALVTHQAAVAMTEAPLTAIEATYFPMSRIVSTTDPLVPVRFIGSVTTALPDNSASSLSLDPVEPTAIALTHEEDDIMDLACEVNKFMNLSQPEETN